MKYIMLWIRLAFGAHSLLSGANYFLEFLPLPHVVHPIAGPFVDSMTAMGLFSVIKGLETLVGLCLITNRFVPLALVAELPTSITIFWLSVITVHSSRSTYTGSKELFFNASLLIFYAGHYKHLFIQKAETLPLWSHWQGLVAEALGKGEPHT
jgi:hypothetical protein